MPEITNTDRIQAARKIAAGHNERADRLARTMLIDVVVGGVKLAREVPRRRRKA